MKKTRIRPGRTAQKHRSLRYFACQLCKQKIRGKPAFKRAGVFAICTPYHPDCLKKVNP